jgi:hypothetical protein
VSALETGSVSIPTEKRAESRSVVFAIQADLDEAEEQDAGDGEPISLGAVYHEDRGDC